MLTGKPLVNQRSVDNWGTFKEVLNCFMAQKLKQNAIFSFLVSKKKKKSACHCVWLSKISLLSPNVYV